MVSATTANILVVDDDLKTLTAMEALLAGPGRNIVTAATGTEALRHLLREDFALILLDIRLPEMDGFETAALIRQRERFRYTPIIFISAIDTLEADVFRGAASGAVDYLFKPVVPQVLKAKVSVFVDLFHMTEQLKQQAIRQTEERFRLVVESLQDYAVFTIDPGGRVSSWNRGAERIGGWRQDEVLVQPFDRFYTREDRQVGRPAAALRQAVAEGRYEEEAWRTRKDGSRFWANLVMTPLTEENGELVGFSAIIRDLTARKRAEEELQKLNAELEKRFAEKTAELVKTTRDRERLQEQLLQAQKLESIGTLAGGIAHDINNLLNVISGYSSSILQNANKPNKLSESVEVITEMVERGSSLVQQLLAMSRKTPTQFQPVQINAVLERLRVLLGETFPKGIDTEWELSGDLPTVLADANQIHQIVLNLCLNARDAMPSGGKLRIQTSTVSGAELRRVFQEATEDHYATVTITDTGAGMDAATKARIFEPFFTTKEVGQGSGLGLAVVYGIVSHHSGFIDVDTAPGRGASFRLCFPVARCESHPAGKTQLRESAQGIADGDGQTILLVEDEKRQLELMQKFLESHGYRVLIARDGIEAVEVFLRHKEEIALALLDIGLPKLNGWDAYHKMRANNPSLKAIVATGFAAHPIESEVAKGDLCGIILKPYQLDDVLERISAAIKSPAPAAALVAKTDGQSLDAVVPDKSSKPSIS